MKSKDREMARDQRNTVRAFLNKMMPMVIGTMLLVLPLHGQAALSDADGGRARSNSNSATSSAASQSISPDVMLELEAMKHRIEQLEAELKARPAAEASGCGERDAGCGVRCDSAAAKLEHLCRECAHSTRKDRTFF